MRLAASHQYQSIQSTAVPAVYLKGKTIVSDSSWLVTYEDKEWIDETGKTSDVSATKWMDAGYWNFDSPANPPSQFKLPVQPQRAVSISKSDSATLVDFGKETFGYIKLHGLEGKGKLVLYYGESREEALSKDKCETLDPIEIVFPNREDFVMPLSKAFRFVNVTTDKSVTVDSVSVMYEYSDVRDKGSFICSDEQINKIYDVAKYTLHLNTREFFIDGIKRDRWIWSGDAYQSYLMNYYLFFDKPTVKRTLFALRGKDPVTSHINTIMDYTFYWFLGIYDYYLYTGDKNFLVQLYPRMQTMMEYVLGRRNKDGLLEGLPGDWIFIDWANGLSKKGEVSFEQMLFARSLETMSLCATLADDGKGKQQYEQLAQQVKQKLFAYYWNPSKQALVHSRVNGEATENVTRYSNMFGIFFNYFNEQQKQEVKKHVLLNDSIQKITAVYAFLRTGSIVRNGRAGLCFEEMKSYWGGDAESWPPVSGKNDPQKRSGALCHVRKTIRKEFVSRMGCKSHLSPGKYYLGVKPTLPGYATYSIEPNLGGLKWMQGTVPTPAGNIEVSCSEKEIKVKGVAGTGTLKFRSKSKPVCQQGNIEKIGADEYSLAIDKDKTYTVNYTNKN